MPLGKVHSWKPIQGTPIDPVNRLAGGLVAAWALNEGAGATLIDPTGHLGLGVSGFGSTNPWGSGTPGPGLACRVAGAGALGTIPTALQVSGPMTIVVVFEFRANPTNWAPILGIYSTNSTATRILSIEAGGSTSTIQNVNLTDSQGGTAYAPATPLAGGVHTYGYTAPGTGSVTEAAYLDGALVASPSRTLSPAWTATSCIAIGSAHPFFSGRNPNVVVYFAGWWSRALTAAEHQAIAQNPWQLFRPNPYYSLLNSAATTTVLFRRTLYDRAGSRGVA